jgi:hypothetical protein
LLLCCQQDNQAANLCQEFTQKSSAGTTCPIWASPGALRAMTAPQKIPDQRFFLSGIGRFNHDKAASILDEMATEAGVNLDHLTQLLAS